ncbi:WD40/YVTN/BNR-like repeat-containing protein [Kitasatospora sp. NPDC088160]|uniref:WD40/YVTN/BNR-like repeat-containing protein n=1 Tax=Kitasatospora sp. NPDC088160 TaxID=3364072 RepID=UPI00381CF867
MASSTVRAGSDKWEALGPFASAATVEAISRPEGGSLLLVSSPETVGGFWSGGLGGTWRVIVPPTRCPVTTCLVGSHADPRRWWLSTGALSEAHESGIFRTDDKGSTWQRLATEPAPGESFRSVCAHREGRFLVAVTAEGSMQVSRDGGDTWKFEDLTADREVADGGATFHDARLEHGDRPVRVVAFAQHGNALFAATAGVWYPGNPPVITAGQGVLRSTDNGSTWHDASGDLPNLDVRTLAVDPDGPCLYAGLRGGSVHRLAL